MAKKKKKKYVNDWFIEYEYQKNKHKCFGRDEIDVRWAFNQSIHRNYKLLHGGPRYDHHEVGKDLWTGWILSCCGKRVNYIMGFRGNRVSESAQNIGKLGGMAGTGKSKVRGDSNYYQLLRLKGLEKRRANSEKNKN